MSEALAQILAQALQLSEDDRAELVDQLLVSLGPGGRCVEPGYEEAWAEELERRSRSIDDGTAVLLSWEEVKKSLQRRVETVKQP